MSYKRAKLWCRFSAECEYECSGNYCTSKRDPYIERFTGYCKADLRHEGPWKVTEFEILMRKALKK